MNRLLYVCLSAIVLTASLRLQAQTVIKTQLEVNIGPIAIDCYDAFHTLAACQGSNFTTTEPACSANANFRTCVQHVLQDYNRQGVVGVRIYFGMNDAGFSTPFLLGPPITFDSSGWLTKLSNFLQDVKAAGMTYVSFTPAWVPFGTSTAAINGCYSGATITIPCNGGTPANFYPWLPWGIDSDPNTGGNPSGLLTPNAIFNAPELAVSQGAWSWGTDTAPDTTTPLYQFFTGIFDQVLAAHLQIREFDLFTEPPLWQSSIYARILYDPLQHVHPLYIVNKIMAEYGFTPTATMSLAGGDPGYTSQNGSNATCDSYFSDSALVLVASQMLFAEVGGNFGAMTNDNVSPSPTNGLYCTRGDNKDLQDLNNIPSYTTLPALPSSNNGIVPVLDIHEYPTDGVRDPGWGSGWIPDTNSSACQYYQDDGSPVYLNGSFVQDCSDDVDSGNSNASSYTAAQLIYSAVSRFTQTWVTSYWLPTNTTVIVGETNAYNPNNTEGSACPFPDSNTINRTDPSTKVVHTVDVDCIADWKWHAPWSDVAAGDNANAFSSTLMLPNAFNGLTTVLRPWAPIGWDFIETPAPLSGNFTLPYNIQQTPGTKVGVFRNSLAFIEDSNGDGVYQPYIDRYFTTFSGPGGFMAGDIPVTGDWTGDGHVKVGIYRSSTGTWFLDANNDGIFESSIDYQYQFGGIPGDTPMVGDWAGLGKDCVGLFRQGFEWVLDLNCSGTFDGVPPDASFAFGGVSEDVPVVGKWTGGRTRVGFVRCYYLGGSCQGYPFFWVYDNADATDPIQADHVPAPGAYAFGGVSGDVYFTGDWYNTGIARAGIYRSGLWVLDADGSHSGNFTVNYGGTSGDVPIVGKW
jgi:hypothetical protein